MRLLEGPTVRPLSVSVLRPWQRSTCYSGRSDRLFNLLGFHFGKTGQNRRLCARHSALTRLSSRRVVVNMLQTEHEVGRGTNFVTGFCGGAGFGHGLPAKAWQPHNSQSGVRKGAHRAFDMPSSIRKFAVPLPQHARRGEVEVSRNLEEGASHEVQRNAAFALSERGESPL
jgi:hypothetical protein